MSSWRRSTRNQNKRRHPGENEDHYQQQNEAPQVPDMNNPGMGMMMGNLGMGLGGWKMGHHATADNYFNMGYQYPHPQYAHHFGHQQQQYHHHTVDDSQGGADEEPTPGSSRSIRARTSGGASNSMTTTGRGRKGGSGPVASTSATTSSMGPPTSGTQGVESTGEDIDDDDDDVDEAGTTTKSKNPHRVETTQTVDQMLQNCLYYLPLQQHKKAPVKRSDTIKNATNSQHKQFSEVMKKLENVLDDVFGMSLVRLGKGKDNWPCVATGSIDGTNAAAEEEVEEPGPSGKKVKGKGAGSATPSYILVSKYPSSVFDSSMLIMARGDPEADTKKTVLYLVLATIFMLNRSIDEELIWKIIKDMGFSQMVCDKRDDLRKFLKLEYVSPGYLNIETTEEQNHPNAAKHSSKEPAPNEAGGSKAGDMAKFIKAKYSWGPRAHKEYSKYSMLKFVTARFPERKMYEFAVQYSMEQKQEKDVIDRELFDDRDTDGEHDAAAPTSADGANGSAIRIKQKPGGRGETFSIDGENTETETDGAE